MGGTPLSDEIDIQSGRDTARGPDLQTVRTECDVDRSVGIDIAPMLYCVDYGLANGHRRDLTSVLSVQSADLALQSEIAPHEGVCLSDLTVDRTSVICTVEEICLVFPSEHRTTDLTESEWRVLAHECVCIGGHITAVDVLMTPAFRSIDSVTSEPFSADSAAHMLRVRSSVTSTS